MSGRTAQVVLKAGRDGPLRGGNPWIFSQALARVEPADLTAGAIVDIHSHDGELLGGGYYNPRTTIAVRVLQWGAAIESIDKLVAARIAAAHRMRQRLLPPATDCYRLLNGDGDGLSGVVIDRYRDACVVQLLTAGAERMRDAVVTALTKLHAVTVYERSQGAVRREEGLDDRVGHLWGEPLALIEACEHGRRLLIDLEQGQKTGYFLDQRDNRAIFTALARDGAVLDAYCYSGGFTLAALAGGARRFVALDSSARALEWAQRNFELNRVELPSTDGPHFLRADVPRYLAETGEKFDLISLDPPPLARSRKDAERAQHLYVALNRLAIGALVAGGSLMTFSCSVHFRGADFIRAVQIAAAQSGRRMRIVRHLGAAGDHPVLLGHVEGEYLTGLWLTELC